jgi:hypothetical protein
MSMWRVNNQTPFLAGKTWSQDKDGAPRWVVCVKATFDIHADGKVRLAGEQMEPLILPKYRGNAGMSSLEYEADLVAPKPTTDILLNGSAYAPNGRASNDFLMSLSVGPLRKTLRVRGDRSWEKGAFGWRPSKASAVLSVPVTYERAFGGFDDRDPDPRNQRIDLRNPVGVGVAHSGSSVAGRALPNFEYPDGRIDKTGPAGFGPVDGHWSPRRELSGTYDEAWERSRKPLLPDDWDDRSLLCSPPDQRLDNHLRGGEAVELLNLTPNGLLKFTLPRINLTFSTRIDGKTQEHRSQLATVLIEPDHPRVILVWCTSVSCRHGIDYLEETLIRQKPVIR